MNKIYTTFATLAIAVIPMFAAGQKAVMHVELNNGTTSDYALSETLKINFAGTPTSFIGTSESKEVFNIPLPTIRKVFFNDSNAVENVAGDTSTLRILKNPVDQTLEFAGAPASACDLAIYSTDGRQVVAVRDWAGQSVDVSALTAGIYIVATNNTAIKFIKK